jgi:hypothetical protein
MEFSIKGKTMKTILKDKEKSFLNYIGLIILNNCNMDYNKAIKIFNLFGIHNVEYKRNTFYVYLERPGVFIGKKGEQLDQIYNELVEIYKNKNLKIVLQEFSIDQYLIPCTYEDF